MRNIGEIFKHRKADIMGSSNQAAVMILLADFEDNPNIIFEVRSGKLLHQPGDICLPGGKIESGESRRDAAIRETMEELSLKRENIEFLGDLDYMITPFNFVMFPFVSKLKEGYEIAPSRDEVDHVFKVPLSFFMETEPLVYKCPLVRKIDDKFPYHLINNGKKYSFREGSIVDYFYKYDDYVIWGFTAKVMKSFADIIKSYS